MATSTIDEKTAQHHKKRSGDGRRAQSAGSDKSRHREYMLDAPPRNYERRHFPDLLSANLTPPWATYSSSESNSSESETSLTHDFEEDSLAKENICTRYASDLPALHASVFELNLPSVPGAELTRSISGDGLSREFPPKYIILPTTYFGLANSPSSYRDDSPPASSRWRTGRHRWQKSKRNASLTDRPPFYPPGPNQHSARGIGSTFDRSQRMREARQLYRSPQSRRALGTPACYRGSSSLSSLRNRCSPVWNAQATSQSLSEDTANRRMPLRIKRPISHQVENRRRDLWRSEPQLDRTGTRSKSKRSGKGKEWLLPVKAYKASPVQCSYWLPAGDLFEEYRDNLAKFSKAKRYPLPLKSLQPQKTTLWYRSDPDLALTTTESELEKTEATSSVTQITGRLKYQSPERSVWLKQGSEFQPSESGAYDREGMNVLVPRCLASSPIQINRTYTKSQRVAYEQELNTLREGVNLQSSTDTAPKTSTDERFPAYRTPSVSP
ncbi:hypothetical protein AAHC03_09537 [Spirometra sp. Aus1]|nr:unnamed protein product [Spirometra erinaceieuropaei]